jgi:hypothetical protein
MNGYYTSIQTNQQAVPAGNCFPPSGKQHPGPNEQPADPDSPVYQPKLIHGYQTAQDTRKPGEGYGYM